MYMHPYWVCNFQQFGPGLIISHITKTGDYKYTCNENTSKVGWSSYHMHVYIYEQWYISNDDCGELL